MSYALDLTLRSPVFRRCASALAIAAASAFAAVPVAAADDPLESVNRKVFLFNGAIDRVLLRPAAVVYRRVAPGPVRRGVRNLFANLREPRTALCQLLQGRPDLGLSDMTRFVINTTVGIGGLFDPAARIGLARHDEDFGRTFAAWGVESGPYLVIPILGSSTLRDSVGSLVGLPLLPQSMIDDVGTRVAIGGAQRVSSRAEQLHLDASITGDPYVFLRDAYLERRP